jgi:hypothetical protein
MPLLVTGLPVRASQARVTVLFTRGLFAEQRISVGSADEMCNGTTGWRMGRTESQTEFAGLPRTLRYVREHISNTHALAELNFQGEVMEPRVSFVPRGSEAQRPQPCASQKHGTDARVDVSGEWT